MTDIIIIAAVAVLFLTALRKIKKSKGCCGCDDRCGNCRKRKD